MARSIQRSFGRKVRDLRLSVGMSQEELADRCGLYRTYLSRIETGQANPTLTMIHALATTLGVGASVMLEEPARTPSPAQPKTRGRRTSAAG